MNSRLLFVCLVLFLAGFAARAGGYTLGWHQIANGGGVSSSARYSLSGTIGQPEASAPIRSVHYILTPGFWTIPPALKPVGQSGRAPLAGSVYFVRPANLTLNIAIHDLLTNVTTAPGATLSFAGVGTEGSDLHSTNGAALATNGTYVHYAGSVTPNVDDSFKYMVRDNLGRIGLGTIYVIMQENAGGQGSPHLAVSQSGVVASFYGVPSCRYSVERCTNLTQGAGWVPISTNFAPANTAIQIQDSFQDLGTVPRSAYYRLHYNP